MLNLDTHIVVDAFRNRLTEHEQELIYSERWSVSSIVLWEVAMLHKGGRIEFDLADHQVSRFVRRLRVWQIDANVARTSIQLDFESDPADELIAATSIVHDVPLVTRDRRIRSSKIVPLAN